MRVDTDRSNKFFLCFMCILAKDVGFDNSPSKSMLVQSAIIITRLLHTSYSFGIKPEVKQSRILFGFLQQIGQFREVSNKRDLGRSGACSKRNPTVVDHRLLAKLNPSYKLLLGQGRPFPMLRMRTARNVHLPRVKSKNMNSLVERYLNLADFPRLLPGPDPIALSLNTRVYMGHG